MGAVATGPDVRERLAAAVAKGDWRAVEESATALLRSAPDDVDALFYGGVADIELRRPREAIERLKRATALAPQRADCATQLARVLSMVSRIDEAIAAAEHALSSQPTDALTLDTLGVVLSRANRHERALPLFERAVATQPGNASYQFNLASSAKFLGDFDRAETAYEACLHAAPHFWRAHSALAQLRTATPARNHLERLTALLPTATAVDARVHLNLAAAKEYEDLDRPADAFRCLVAGKSAKRATLRHDASIDAQMFDALHEVFATFVAPARTEADGPIFVVGMPRTGTTLVDRILSSHSQVRSVGELQAFGHAIKRASGVPSPRILDPGTIRAAARADLGAVGPTYEARALEAAGTDAHRTVDKTPLNFLYAGFIARALPDARIVCLRRDPLDACLANFRQLFSLEGSYYDYSWDLLDTGHYYLQFDRLVALWRRVLPGRFLEVRYENLVSDQAGTTRALLEHCGLPWEDACLAFERNAAPVSTASAVQVRQPLYATSVGRWRRYEEELRPLRDMLTAAGAL